MNPAELDALIDRLRAEPHETEWLEFKDSFFDPQTLGEYLSALANSAGLLGKPRAYLVFGIEDGSHKAIGTQFNPTQAKAAGNQPLRIWLVQGLQPNIGFEIHSHVYQTKPIVLFEIQPAIDRPVKFRGEAFICDGSSKTSLSRYPDKERRLWNLRRDWSDQVCDRASWDDLDPAAVAKARQEFCIKYPAKNQETAQWDIPTFLNKIQLTRQGHITNAALLLLGKPEASSFLDPAVARISWILKNDLNEEQDYEHFTPPFILSVDRLLSRIRNLKVRELPDNTLFPVELEQYDPWVIREALHNCIAHQDYGLKGRIQVIEFPNSLLLSNVGSFLPGTIEAVIRRDAPLEIYRNSFLAEAMVNLNMIDTQGGGIKKMFKTQRSRFFPLPDYNLTDPQRVEVRIEGRILDVNYTRLLMRQTTLDLETIILLDRVQKRQAITKEEHRRLKADGLVEGRYPKLLIAAKLASTKGQKAIRIRSKGFNNQYYRDLIVQIVREHQPVEREVIDSILLNKLPEILTEEQKVRKIHNLMMNLSRKQRFIINQGSRRHSQWVLAPATDNNNKKQ